jgi:4a-hydroxytetrahydrobiopterin dehydratase
MVDPAGILFCMNKTTVSTPDEIEAFITEYPTWKFKSDTLQLEHTCNSFEEAISVINQLAQIFSELDHHPTIENTYNSIKLTLTTHDAGNKVTGIDIAVATRVAKVLREME